MAPKHPKDHRSTAEGERDVAAGKAQPEPEPNASRDTAVERARQDEERRRRESQARKRWDDRVRRRLMSRPMEQRSYFSMAEVADRLPFRTVKADGLFGPDLEIRWEVAKQLVTFMVARSSSNPGEIILLGDGPVRLTGVDFRMVWDAAVGDWGKDIYGAQFPYPSFLKNCYIARKGAVAFFQRQSYPWPADWGASLSAESTIPIETRPAKQDAAIEAEIKEVQPATESVTRIVAPMQKADIDTAYKLRIAEGQYPTVTEDEAWGKKIGISRPRIRELRAKYRDAKAKKGGHPKGRQTN